MPHLVLFLIVACLALGAGVPRPIGDGGWISAARADDDDDDDDDDGPRPGLRLILPRFAPAPTPRRPAPAQAPAPLPAFAPNEILARGLNDQDLSALEAEGFSLIRSRDLSNGTRLHRLRKPARLTMPEARQMVRQRASINAADYNHYYRAEQAAGCQGAECPARDMIGWPARMAGCGLPVRIGMVDTGLNGDHAVFKGAAITVHRVDDSQAPSDQVHGTAVAALLVGRGDSRSPGLVPHATLIAVDAFQKVGDDQRADAFALVEALDLLGQSDVGVINLSLAGPANEALAIQIDELDAQGVVIVAAAGNFGPRAKPAYPAAYPNVVAVTAVDRRGDVYRRANRGGHIDLAAPGVDVWTAASVSGARTKTGTSFAAPFVTAAAALLLQSEPSLTPAEIRTILRDSARDLGNRGPDDIFGHGLVIAPDPCAVTSPEGGAIVPASAG